ncbi:MAG: rod shape-determining protein MreC [Pelagibacterales bacterium]|nr:rod shape-determining protein MreC [Pelagibacterales bacterium]
MANLSNFKRVRSLIKERTSSKKLLTGLAFSFALLIIISSLTNFHFTNVIKLKFLDYSSYILKSFYMPLNTFKNSGDNINNIFYVYRNNKNLIIENENLKSQLIEQKFIRKENIELRNLLNVKKENSYSFVTAKILSQSNFSFSHSMILSVGLDNNISINSPVIYKNQLVGYISDVGNKSSRVRLITDINSKIPVLVLDKNIKFIMSGDNNNYLKFLNFGNINLLENGDEVYTSGDGGMYPKGLMVGKVIKKSKNQLVIEPSLTIGKLDYLQIIDWTALSRGIDIKVDNTN